MDREHYFIRASYQLMKSQTEQAMAAYQALISLYPDDYWATCKLALANRKLGRIPEALKYVARQADLRPNSVADNVWAGRWLAMLGGDLVAAEPYMERARQLMASEDLLGADDAVANVSLFPAWKALIDGDPQEALQLTDQAAATIKRPQPNGRLLLLRVRETEAGTRLGRIVPLCKGEDWPTPWEAIR